MDSKEQETNGSVNVLTNDDLTFGKKRKSRGELCLILCAVFFFLTTALFAGLFAYYYITSDDEDDLCLSNNCVETASSMLTKMDIHADPCEDFYQYSCGRFVRESAIPKGHTSIQPAVTIHEANQRVLTAILEEKHQTGEERYLTLLRNLFHTCIDEDAIEQIGIKPYLESDFAKRWPTILNTTWDSSSYNLSDTLITYVQTLVNPLFDFTIMADLKNSSIMMLTLEQPSLLLPKEYYEKERNDSKLMALERYYRDFAIEFGADPKTAAQDAVNHIDFEKNLSRILVASRDLKDREKLYRPKSLQSLLHDYPYIDIPSIYQAAFSLANISLPSNETIVDITPAYFEQLGEVLNSTDPRIIQNAFGFSHALIVSSSFTKRLRDIRYDLNKAFYGTKERKSREKTCVSAVASTFGRAMSKEFVKRTFPEESKAMLNEMIGHLYKSFRSILQEADWMGPETTDKAIAKLEKMKSRIGYPDEGFSDEDINKELENITMTTDHYYNNQEAIREWGNRKRLRKILSPPDDNKWQMNPHEVNAFHAFSSNSITFLAGYLQPPFFSSVYPKSVNYGSIGSTIGHEITHGFDTSGRQYDENGNVNNWWASEDLKRFNERKQCLVEQYGNFTVPGTDGLKINGLNTLAENIADNGGLKESFRAYQNSNDNWSPLPGLGLNNEQTFFLAYAQQYCEKYTKLALQTAVLAYSHAPGKYRVLGPLQNSKDFARVFNCKSGSTMNPTDKCAVW